MNIPDEQLDAISTAAAASIQGGVIGYRRSYVDAIIAEWEKMQSENPSFADTRDALGRVQMKLAEAEQRIADLAADNKALHEALPEWIPITGLISPDQSLDGWITYLTDNGKTWCGPGNCAEDYKTVTHYLSNAALAALPKREPEPIKPTDYETYIRWATRNNVNPYSLSPSDAFKAGRESK